MKKWWLPGRLMPMSTAKNYHHQCLCPHSEPQPPCLRRRLSNTSSRSGLGSSEVTAFPLGWCTQDVLCALQEWSFCFPRFSGILVIKPHWLSKADSLGPPPPIARPPGWGAWYGAQKFHFFQRTSVIKFSSLWVTHLGGLEFDFIMIMPLILSCCGFFGCRISFLVGSTISCC